MPAYTASPAKTARFAPILPAIEPNRNANGTPMNCVMSSARIMALSSMFSSAPYVVAIRTIVWMPSL